MTVQCCVCLKIRSGNEWLEVAKPDEAKRTASHTYCPKCAEVSFGRHFVRAESAAEKQVEQANQK